MIPSKAFDLIFDVLTAHDKQKMWFGRFLLTMEYYHLLEIGTNIVAHARVYEKSGFLGLKRRLLYCVKRTVKDGVMKTQLLYAPPGDWYKEFQEEVGKA